jgi:hypothetical protein
MATTTATYRVLGTTNEITECDHCGRRELKGTIVLGIVDVDGNVEDRVYFGAVCGARAAGKPVRDLRKEAVAADNERLAEVRRARVLARRAEDEAFGAWAYENYGPAPARYLTKSIHELRAEFTAARA